MAYDRRYFARPARTLFTEIRDHFPLADQVSVYMVVERNVNLALEHLEQLPRTTGLDGRPRQLPGEHPQGHARASASRCRAATTARRTSTSRSCEALDEPPSPSRRLAGARHAGAHRPTV